MKNLEVIANALGWEIVPYRGWYDLDKINGSRSFYCDTLNDVALMLAKIIKEGDHNG